MMPVYWLRLAAVFRARNGVVQVHDQRGLIVAAPAAILARRPLVWHIHGINRTALVNRIGARLADHIVVPSRTALRRMPGLESFFFQAEDGIRVRNVTGVQTCALPIFVLAAAVKLAVPPLMLVAVGLYDPATLTVPPVTLTVPAPLTLELAVRLKVPLLNSSVAVARSEERRVGKEGRCRWPPRAWRG